MADIRRLAPGETILHGAVGQGIADPELLDHEMLGEPSFGTGRWLGWIYIDLNRPDLYGDDHVVRLCSVTCALWWLERECVKPRRVVAEDLTPLDRALRAPNDAVARRRAGLGKRASL